jgi:hypothetical protein
MALVPHQEYRMALLGVLQGFQVYLGYQWAGGIHHLQTTLPALLPDIGGHTVGAEDHSLSIRHLIQLLHEDGSLVSKVGYNVGIVHYLTSHVDGRAKALQAQLYHIHGPHYAGAESTWGGKDYFHVCLLEALYAKKREN